MTPRIWHKVHWYLLNALFDFHGLILNSSISSTWDTGSKTKKLSLYLLINLEQYLLRKKETFVPYLFTVANWNHQNLQDLHNQYP